MPLPRERRAPALLAILAAAPGFLASAGCATSSLPLPSAPATSDSSSQPPEVPNRSARSARTWGWVSVAIGAEAAVVAVITSAVMLHDKNQRDADCNAQKVCTPAGLDANISLTQLAGWNAAAWIIAAAGLGTGGVLLWKF